METNGRYVMENNYRYSRALLDWCQDEAVPFLYASSASVYGAGREFREERACERPLNAYAYSKFLFDQHVRRRLPVRSAQIAGFRYFNVYGPNEAHKGRMASVAFHAFNQFVSEGRVRLFAGSDGYADGEQRRDFIHVEDVVNVNLYFLEHREAIRDLQLRHRSCAELQRRRARSGQRRARRARRSRALVGRHGRGRPHRIHPVSTAAGRKVPELH